MENRRPVGDDVPDNHEAPRDSRTMQLLIAAQEIAYLADSPEDYEYILEGINEFRAHEQSHTYLFSAQIHVLESFSLDYADLITSETRVIQNHALNWDETCVLSRAGGEANIALVLSDPTIDVGDQTSAGKYLVLVDELFAMVQAEPENRSVAPEDLYEIPRAGDSYIEGLRRDLEDFERGLVLVVSSMQALYEQVAQEVGDAELYGNMLAKIYTDFMRRHRDHLEGYTVEATGPGLQLPSFTATEKIDDVDGVETIRGIDVEIVGNGRKRDDLAVIQGRVSEVEAAIESLEPFMFDSYIQIRTSGGRYNFNDNRGRVVERVEVSGYAYAPLDGTVSFSLPELEKLRARDRALETAKRKLAAYPVVLADLEKLYATVQQEIPSYFIDIDADRLASSFILLSDDPTAVQVLSDVTEDIIGRGRVIRVKGQMIRNDGSVRVPVSYEPQRAKFLHIVSKHPFEDTPGPLIALGDDNDVQVCYVAVHLLEALEI